MPELREQLLNGVVERLEQNRNAIPNVDQITAIGRTVFNINKKIVETVLERFEEILTPEQKLHELYNKRDERG